MVSFQAFLAHDSFGRVGSTHHQQVLLHQKSRRDTRPKQQVSHSIHCFTLSFMLIVFSCITAAQYCILKHLLLPHRGNLFLLTYLMFPVNVLIGVLLGVWRMIITALFNIVHMGRMDISLLNRNVEAFDPGEPDVRQTAMIKLSGNGIW